MRLTKELALAACDALEATGAYKLDEERNFINHTGLCPLWIENLKPDVWYVRNGGVVRETTAVSREDAINKVRYIRFGLTRTEDCGEFEAVCPCTVVAEAVGAARRIATREREESNTTIDLFGKRKLTKMEALARIRRMAS